MSIPSYPSPCRPVVGSGVSEDCLDEFRAAPEGSGCEIVGNSAAMARLRLQVRRIGPHFRTVLVSGEAGTGKELVARALHRANPNATGPFLVCRASTLEDGRSISGDTFDRLMSSDQGTLFLGGISEMPLQIQDHLLDVLRRGDSWEGLGLSERPVVRIVASTREDLKVLAAAGRFRMELCQRIAMLEISVPPLRDHAEDISMLATHFVSRFARGYGRPVSGIARSAIEQLADYRWPGNVRELEGILRKGVLQCGGLTLQVEHLPAFRETCGEVGGMRTARLQDVVEQHVLHVLKSCDGNKVRAAELLGISRSTLYRMLDACASSAGANAAGSGS
jgi:DNA-binding NtrC family response regulator